MMLDPLPITAFASILEKTLNGALHYDPASQQRLSTIEGILAIESTAPSITLYFEGTADGIAVMGHCESTVTTHLKGSPLALAKLLQQPTSLADSGVSLTGSTSLLQKWQHLLNELDIDWEEPLSRLLGDILGPIVAKQLRSTGQWVKAQAQQQQRMMSEYLPNELGVVPNKAELHHFNGQIDQLRLDVDRLSARLDKLLKRIATSESQQ